MAHLAFPNGEADVVIFDGERITLRATFASAPGSPIAGTLGAGALVRVKVHRCKKQEDHFFIEGRLVDATRKLREDLARLVAPPA